VAGNGGGPAGDGAALAIPMHKPPNIRVAAKTDNIFAGFILPLLVGLFIAGI
jgi:hypothetical protein